MINTLNANICYRPSIAFLFLLVLFSVSLISIRPAYAEEGVVKANLVINDSLSQGERKQMQRRISDLKQMYEECRQGKRGEDEKYVILKRMLQTYGMLKSTDTVEAITVKKDWDALLKKHPEFKTNSPSELKEESEFRNKQDAQTKALQLKADKFVPQDTRVLAIYGIGDKVVAQYQYRVDFFRLPKDMALGGKKNNIKAMRGSAEIPISDLKSFKTLSFKTRFGVYPMLPRRINHPLWLCSDLMHGYSPNTDEEDEIIRIKGHENEGLPWKNMHGEFENFCGVVSFDGEIIYQLPFSQRVPDKLLDVIEVSNEGKKAFIVEGERTGYTDTDPNAISVGKYRKVYVWEYPDKLKEYDINDSSIEIQSFLTRWGLK